MEAPFFFSSEDKDAEIEGVIVLISRNVFPLTSTPANAPNVSLTASSSDKTVMIRSQAFASSESTQVDFVFLLPRFQPPGILVLVLVLGRSNRYPP